MSRIGRKLGKAKHVASEAAGRVKESAEQLRGPSPNPDTNLLLADVALRSGSMLARRGIEKGLLGAKYTPEKAKNILKSRTLGATLFHTAVAKIATRSVPGAILVGGGLLAKTLYDRRRGRKATIEGERELHERAAKGEKQGS